MAQTISPSELVACLSGIRVMLNWKRMFEEGWNCSVVLLKKKCELSSLCMPWYVFNGNQTEHTCSGAEPVTVGNAAQDISVWQSDRRDGITKYAAQFQAVVTATNEPIRIALPAYRLPDKAGESKWLLLDGNHRAVGLVRTNVRFEVTLFSIDGPVDENALPDLIHWKSDEVD